MRTQKEIVTRIHEAMKRDPLGFEWHEYINAITKETAETLKGTALKADADLSDWTEPWTEDDVRKQAINYMEFAWEKANNCRGISAARSLSHYKAWLWLLGENSFDDIDEYEHYGKAHLRRICEYFGLDADKWDDDIRTNEG